MKNKLKNYWKKNKEKFEEITEKLDYLPRGVLYTEGFFLCSIFDLLKVDLILESGTAHGHSTELMANYFNKEIITVDAQTVCKAYKQTSLRLAKYSYISCKQGDSFDVLPGLVEKNKNKKIGVFIDGPKHGQARKLGKILFEYPNVSCVMYHDQFINTEMDGKLFDTRRNGELGFINEDYGYLNDKAVKKSNIPKRRMVDGFGVFAQLK